MKKCVIWFLTMALAVSCLAGCGKTGSQDESSVDGQADGQNESSKDGQADGQNESYEDGHIEAGAEGACTFTDDLGREVTVESHQRVAALLGSYADMWVLAGGEVCAAPDDAFEDFELNLPEGTVNLGETKAVGAARTNAGMQYYYEIDE